jgi:hypothetical protein
MTFDSTSGSAHLVALLWCRPLLLFIYFKRLILK